jgi:FkbH-like protein
VEGRLTLEHFVSRQINWDPKPLNMKRIAEHLNLKEKDFVFIDDRADERAMVASAYPQMATLDATDPRSWRLLALWSDLLPTTAADRTDFYRQRDARQAFIAAEAESSADDRAAHYAELQLTLAIREAGPDDIARVADLLGRTNQFNMTGNRLSKREVEALVADPAARVLVAEAGDRFGTMGIISILVAERRDSETEITNFVLSCRVFGYGMEFAILRAAASLLAGGEALSGIILPTQFNQPCLRVYADAGFVQDGAAWRADAFETLGATVPAWLAVTTDVAPFAAPAAQRSND